MNWIQQVIGAHERDLAKRPDKRREELIGKWRGYQTDGLAQPAIDLAIQLAEDGTANESELGFYILMDLGLSDASLLYPLRQLTMHRSSKVRRGLAFYLTREFPTQFCAEIYRELLNDKAASVRARAIECIGIHELKSLLPELQAMRSTEQNQNVVKSLDYWIPLIEIGYRVEFLPIPGQLVITALINGSTPSTTLETNDPCDPRISNIVAELRSFAVRYNRKC
jgi:hypothetical protein